MNANSLIILIVGIAMGCDQEESSKKNLVDKRQSEIKQFVNYVTGDINKDQKNDTVFFKPKEQNSKIPFDFDIVIKYTESYKFLEKKISSERNTDALFYGIKINENLINIRFTDESLNDFTFEILFEKGKFFLLQSYEVQPRKQISMNYELFDGDKGMVEIDAASVCRYKYNDYILMDTLRKGNGLKECKLIPAINGKAEAEIEEIVNTPLFK